MSFVCDDCGEDFEDDDEFALIEDGETLCSFCNSDEVQE